MIAVFRLHELNRIKKMDINVDNDSSERKLIPTIITVGQVLK